MERRPQQGAGLPADTYRIKLMSSLRGEILEVPECDINVKFGNGPNQMKPAFPTDNSNVAVVFTGQVQEGGTIRIAVHSTYKGWSDLGFINGLIIEKID